MEKERIGEWIQTYTGRKFWPLDPRPEEICIEDIAHSLSLLCRFGGHCKEFYSVAQHSCLGVLLARHDLLTTKQLQFHFLMHDASEAYLVDVPRPLKKAGEFGILYKKIEAALEAQIAIKFNLQLPMPTVIKSIDTRMLLTERRAFLHITEPWQDLETNYPPFETNIRAWAPSEAKEVFMQLFNDLGAY